MGKIDKTNSTGVYNINILHVLKQTKAAPIENLNCSYMSTNIRDCKSYWESRIVLEKKKQNSLKNHLA